LDHVGDGVLGLDVSEHQVELHGRHGDAHEQLVGVHLVVSQVHVLHVGMLHFEQDRLENVRPGFGLSGLEGLLQGLKGLLVAVGQLLEVLLGVEGSGHQLGGDGNVSAFDRGAYLHAEDHETVGHSRFGLLLHAHEGLGGFAELELGGRHAQDVAAPVCVGEDAL